MQPQTAVAGGTWRKRRRAGRGRRSALDQSKLMGGHALLTPFCAPYDEQACCAWGHQPSTGCGRGCGAVGGEHPSAGADCRSHTHAHAPLNTTTATNAHHHAGSVASHITRLQAWHHRRHQPHRPLPLTTLAGAFDRCLPARLPPPHLASPVPCLCLTATLPRHRPTPVLLWPA